MIWAGILIGVVAVAAAFICWCLLQIDDSD